MGGSLFHLALDCTVPQLSHAPASPPKPRRMGSGRAAGIAATRLFPTDPIPTSAPPAHTPAARSCGLIVGLGNGRKSAAC
jgi:hypothetical protein